MKGYALRKILSVKLAELQEQNKAYSLRAFARKLELSPTSLSLLLSGKRYPSLKMANKICLLLKLSPKEEAEALELYHQGQSTTWSKLNTEELLLEKQEVWQRELDFLLGKNLGQKYCVNIQAQFTKAIDRAREAL